MKIIIFSGYLSPKLNANNKIAYTIAEEMALKGHDVILAGVTTNENAFTTLTTTSESGRFRCIYITPNERFFKEREKLGNYIANSSSSRFVSAVKYGISHPLSAIKALYSYSPLFHPADKVPECQKFLADLASKEKSDCIIAVTFPQFSLPVVFDSNIPNCKKAIYQLDPMGLHEDNTDENRESWIDFELKYFAVADCIFTTDILCPLYKKTGRYSEFADKIHIAPFPTLLRQKNSDFMPLTLCKDKTNIVFCGTVDDRYRSPEKFLHCMEKIWDTDKNIAVHFVGINNSLVTVEYAEKYPENIFIHPRIDTQYVPALLNNADILLNIGNTYRLQVPSKIFEYFATGKPVIHQQVTDNCSCLEYMDRYPLAFCFNDCSETSAHMMLQFIRSNSQNRLDWDCVADIFTDNMPVNVAANMLETIE